LSKAISVLVACDKNKLPWTKIVALDKLEKPIFLPMITLIANLAQSEHNHLNFLKGKVFKGKVLCLLDIGASHNFIIRKSGERMELQLE
jgi:hypothetical protein